MAVVVRAVRRLFSLRKLNHPTSNANRSLLDANGLLCHVVPSLSVVILEGDANVYVVVRHRAQMQNEAGVELIVLELFVENHILVVLVLGAHLRAAGREQRRLHASIGIVAGGHLIDQRRLALALLLNLFARQHFDEHLLHRAQRQAMVGRFDLAVDLHR